MITFKFWIFKLSDLDQGMHKYAVKKKIGVFSVFKKKLISKKEKKSNISESRTTLRTQKNKFCMQNCFYF